ncbi:MAG: PQQ-dependent sugar dehydrogenase [Tetrasphaera sp.]
MAVPRAVVPLDGGRLLVAGQEGLVLVIEDGKRRSRPFLDISTRIDGPTAGYLELGMPGFALAPDFATSGRFYTFATLPPRADDPEGSVRVDTLSRWRADPTSLIADPKSREDLLAVPRPMADHVAGEIVFDASGRLYTAFGAESFSATAQDPNDLAGKVIRIDPRQPGDANTPYGIPDDNPYAAGGGRKEIFSSGYRNPWRLAWTGDLGLLVGSAMFTDKPQQLNAPRPGDNAGYPEVRTACWVAGAVSQACRTTAAGAAITPPVLEYGVQVGTILSGVAPITGGATDNPLRGQVLVADWSGSVLAAQPGQAPWPFRNVLLPKDVHNRSQHLWDLAAGPDGSVYALITAKSMTSGKVVHLAP